MSIASEIIKGTYDDELEAISDAADERRHALSRSTFFDVKIGDRFTLKNLSPKYMTGAPVTVSGKRRTRIEVDIDSAWMDAHPQAKRRFGTGRRVGVTAAMLEPIPSDAPA